MNIPTGVVFITAPLLPEGREYGFAVDPCLAYPDFCGRLGYDPHNLTKGQVECVRKCLTEYLHRQAKAEKYVKS